MTGLAMVPWDVVVTGAVGIAGIAGTILATRMTAKAQAANLLASIDAENKRARVAEKRRIYAAFFASLDGLMLAAYNYRFVKGKEHSDEEIRSAFDELMRAEGVSTRCSMELRLIAAPPVRQLVWAISEAYGNYTTDTFDGETELVKVKEPFPMHILIDAMRVDLGDDE